jgi:ABC-type tungstate transport system substrate-binding protein
MSYGWILGQRHQSGYDVAGILLFMTGLVGLVLALILYFFTRKHSWHAKWVLNALLGLAGCAVGLTLILVYARLHG